MSTFPRMLQHYTERQFGRLETLRSERLEKVNDRSSAERYVAECREAIRSIYRLPPDVTSFSRNDLPEPRTTKQIEHDRYSIETILFESLPGILVTANLYLPSPRHFTAGPYPAVLGVCGHSEDGKAQPKYQSFCAGLASKGFVVLIFDPMSQGERYQYPDRLPPISGCVGEHVVLGAKLSLLGEFYGSYAAFDAIRALDILLDRPEVDATRVGMTGNSGGGTMTTIITALEDRLTMAAPSCFVTTYRRNLENELPADTEQIPPLIIAHGYELFDHITASAPRPTLLLAKEDDYFDRRGTEEAFTELRRLYGLLGAGDDIERFVGRFGHGFDRDLREAMYGFFCRHAGIDTAATEPEDIEIHAAEELFATPRGSVLEAGSPRFVDFARERLDRLESMRVRPVETSTTSGTEGPTVGNPTDPFVATLATILGVADDSRTVQSPPRYRVLRRRRDRSRLALETEEDIQAILTFRSSAGPHFSIPKGDRAVLVVSGTEPIDVEEAKSVALGRQVPVRSGETSTLFHCSPRGLGESLPDTCGGQPYEALYDTDFFYTSYGIMMGKPLVGGRVYDVKRTADLLIADGYRKITLCGAAFGGLLALYAAPFIAAVDELLVEGTIDRLASIVGRDYLPCPISYLPLGILTAIDLDDIRAHLERQGVTVL